jgi:hypothetical protein
MPTFIGHPKEPPNPAEQRAEQVSQHVAEVYVNRRKVGEHRAATEEEALAQARQDKQKYPGARVNIVLREAPRSKHG